MVQRRTLIAAGASTLAAPWVRAQSLPTSPIRIIVGFPPGGGTDILARVLAPRLQELWKTWRWSCSSTGPRCLRCTFPTAARAR